MSHVTGSVQLVTPPLTIGPDSGQPANGGPNTWTLNFQHTPSPAPGGTKLLILHFQSVSLPASNRLEVDLGYDTDVFTSADGNDLWTRPVNVSAVPGGLVPIRYITNGSNSGGATLDKYGRGERHAGEQDPNALSNCDPFLVAGTYTEPTTSEYDPLWFCHTPPHWENSSCVAPPDVRAQVAPSVGMIMGVEHSNFSNQDVVSTCSVTLVGPDLVLTAGHCHTPSEALRASVTFDYAIDCNGATPGGYDARFHKVVRVVKHRWQDPNFPGFDYSLLQIRLPPGGLGITPIPMRADLPGPNEQVFCIHHPNGAVKKLSTTHPAFATITASSSAAITTQEIDISGGSSGSGLFDAAGNILGVLTASPNCALNYFPVSTILPDLAAPEGPPLNRDVMLVFDRSGSMSLPAGTGRTKIEEARDAAALFVELVRAGQGNRIGLVSFSTTASSPVDAAIAAATQGTKNNLVGPPPHTTGVVGSLAPGGNTTIGGGLDAARLQFPAPGANSRAILLMTDGLENTPPMIVDVDGGLAGIDVHAIGFGTESSLDGVKLSNLVQRHNGLYTRAGSGLALKKFFALAFGNIFEAGALTDPEGVLAEGQSESKPLSISVCDEDTITAVVGWDGEDVRLHVVVRAPSGTAIPAVAPGVEEGVGRTWHFLRIPLPQGGEREGTWTVVVARERGVGELEGPRREVRYFTSVLASGGPSLRSLVTQRIFYTGDTINPRVVLRYADSELADNAVVKATVTKPATAAGDLLSDARLRPPEPIDGDTLPARQATLRALEQSAGGPVLHESEETFDLSDEPADTGGILESAGVFGKVRDDLLTVEGNYTFHVVATYGDTCKSSREAIFAVHVDIGIDPGKTDVTTQVGAVRPDGRRGVTVTFVPRDRFGHRLGPGRGDSLTVDGSAGTVLTGPVVDNGDGSYTATGTWDPGSGTPPGVVIQQPGRPGVTVSKPTRGLPSGCLPWVLAALFFVLALVFLLLWLLT
ncbi:MAG TPA: trypsin-like peptidase domain-containing protein [Gaiellaceae bacterium]